MKALTIIVLSFIAIAAALILAISTDCAFNEARRYRDFAVICAAISLPVACVTVWAIVKLIRTHDEVELPASSVVLAFHLRVPLC